MIPAVLFVGSLPLIILLIVLRLFVWVGRVNREQDGIKLEPIRFVENPYADVRKDEEEYGDRTDYR